MSTAEVRRRYKRELAGAQLKLDPPVLPPAMQLEEWRQDQRCDRCRCGTGRIWNDDGTRYRRCKPCEEAK